VNDGRMNASRGDDRAASGSAARPARSSSKIPSHARPAPKPHPGGTPPNRPPALPPLDAVVPEDLRVEHTRDTVEYMKNLAPPRITTRADGGASKTQVEAARWREEAAAREDATRARDAAAEDERARLERERLAAAWRVFKYDERPSATERGGGGGDGDDVDSG
jgi:hypothetical protein